jgi:hypothetical protein
MVEASMMKIKALTVKLDTTINKCEDTHTGAGSQNVASFFKI